MFDPRSDTERTLDMRILRELSDSFNSLKTCLATKFAGKANIKINDKVDPCYTELQDFLFETEFLDMYHGVTVHGRESDQNKIRCDKLHELSRELVRVNRHVRTINRRVLEGQTELDRFLKVLKADQHVFFAVTAYRSLS
jgi:hypothetical protein